MKQRSKICKCITCGKETKLPLSQLKIKGRGKYCSKKCRYPQKVEYTCKYCKKTKFVQPAVIRKGVKYCSYACKAKDYKIIKKGKNNPCWKGGITRLGHSIRTSDRYLRFRKEILIRDGGYCKECGSYKKLEIHHIIPLWKILEDFKKTGKKFNPEDDYFYEKENLITLCRICHRKYKV